MIYEIITYPEHDRFCEENEKIGYYGNNSVNPELDIWICELFQNKITKLYSILITKDSDEMFVIDFEEI